MRIFNSSYADSNWPNVFRSHEKYPLKTRDHTVFVTIFDFPLKVGVIYLIMTRHVDIMHKFDERYRIIVNIFPVSVVDSYKSIF